MNRAENGMKLLLIESSCLEGNPLRLGWAVIEDNFDKAA